MQRPGLGAGRGAGASLGEVAQQRIDTDAGTLLHVERLGLRLSDVRVCMDKGEDSAT